MANYRNEPVTIDCELKDETDKAWIIVVDGDTHVIPKSIGDFTPSTDGVTGEITMPTWKAEQEGLA